MDPAKLRTALMRFSDFPDDLPRKRYTRGQHVQIGGCVLQVVETTPDGVLITDTDQDAIEWYPRGPGRTGGIRLKNGKPFANRE